MEPKKKKISYLYIIPLLILVSIIPLIVYLKRVPLEGAMFTFWKGEEYSPDFFSYYKMVWILVCTAITLISFLVILINKKIAIKKTYLYIPITIYSVLVILSTMFSEYNHVSLFGFIERYEGMVVLLAYMLILVITMNLVDDEKKIKILLSALIFSAVIIGTIGVFQYLGHDIWQSNFGKKLMLPKEFEKYADDINFKFGANVIYGTLYHYNYVGSYMAMLFPLTFTLALLSKNKMAKIGMALISILMFTNWIASNSRAGIVGGTLALIVLIIMIRKQIFQKWKYVIGALGIFAVILLGFNKASEGALANRIQSLIEEAGGLAKAEAEYPIDDVVVEGDTVIIINSKVTLKVQNKDGELIFKDGDDNNLEVSAKSGEIKFKDSKYKDYRLNLKTVTTPDGKKVVVQVNKNNIKLNFIALKDGFKFINHKGKAVDLKPVEQWGFEGKETLGSARGYIWSRSIPLLKDTVLLGYGPDTFAIYFPQGDYIGKLKAYGTMGMIVDKPHNLYLQIALSTGVASLIAFIALFIMYFLSSVKLYFKNDYIDFYSIVGLGIFVAVIGYLGAGFFNDSVVSVAPVFWVLLGVGVSINMRLGSGNK